VSVEKNIKIEIRDLTFCYPDRFENRINVLERLNLEVYDQEFLSIVGVSGCGKSTLLNIVAGLLPPSTGKVYLDGREVSAPGPDRVMVFQDDAVFPWYTVKENVAYGLKMAGMDKKQLEQEVDTALRLVGLSDNTKMYPRQLSGGMRKRVDVARAIITKPQVLLMDEPFAALDVLTKQKLQEEFLKIWNAARMTVIFVTHDLEEALYMADRVVVMSSHPGRITRVVEVPFGRPRDRDIKTLPQFQDLRRELSHILDERMGESI
jgi:NitT/TauT family transport system ATP-binding protein